MTPRLALRSALPVLAVVALGALAPLFACGGSDDDDGATSGHDAGGADGSLTAEDSGAPSGLDATTQDGSAGSKLDSGTGADAADAAFPDSATSDAASGTCQPVNGVFTLTGPSTGSTRDLCPTETGITCHFATESGSCELVTQCKGEDGGPGTGLFAIPSGMLDGNDTLTYSATYPLPGLGGIGSAGNLTASCSLHFGSDPSSAKLTCAGSVPLVGNVVSCSYAGGRTDAGL